ncbi:hypothetical protein ACFSJS_22720 [Streptomyces desertarenae]|uniref:Uncharacterized protein n=1 Tax=Streptomyces desertarenae TaxID=2666184 RepID=A0ABW4PNW9_9ACTN
MSRIAITGALFVDMGEGHAIRSGDRAGQITYKRQPRARYECLTCRATEGPVEGPAAVARFVAEVRAVHAARCGTPAARQAA